MEVKEERRAINSNGIRAFSDPQYDYYRLTKPLGDILAPGAVFVHDKYDRVCGSYSGCLKLCWNPDGNCYHSISGTSLCANTIILHAGFAELSGFFELVQTSDDPIEIAIQSLTQQRDLLSRQIDELIKRRNSH